MLAYRVRRMVITTSLLVIVSSSRVTTLSVGAKLAVENITG